MKIVYWGIQDGKHQYYIPAVVVNAVLGTYWVFQVDRSYRKPRSEVVLQTVERFLNDD